MPVPSRPATRPRSEDATTTFDRLLQLACWEDLLGLDPSDDRLHAEQARLEAVRSALRTLSQQLVAHGRAALPTAPVYLAHAPDRSHTLLRWRSREARRRGVRLEIDDPEVVAWLAASPAQQRRLFVRLDRARCILNHHFAVAVYASQSAQRQRELRQKRTTVVRQLNSPRA